MVSHWAEAHGIEAVGFNKGGTVALGEVRVTMVTAVHSSSWPGPHGPVYGGAEAGFMIAGEGRTVYFSGDTDVTAEMAVFQELHRPEIGILCAGGHYTMDMERAAFAARKFFDFETVIPCHYRTFPQLEQSAEKLVAGLPGVRVLTPEPMEAVEL
jgi:L-ascorbate metabolism protein UlaG (beta-lactamase superfamily)